MDMVAERLLAGMRQGPAAGELGAGAALQGRNRARRTGAPTCVCRGGAQTQRACLDRCCAVCCVWHCMGCLAGTPRPQVTNAGGHVPPGPRPALRRAWHRHLLTPTQTDKSPSTLSVEKDGVHPPAVVVRVACAVAAGRPGGECLSSLYAREVANVAWAYGRAGHLHRGLAAALADRAAAAIAEFEPSELSNVLWAYGALSTPADRCAAGAPRRVLPCCCCCAAAPPAAR